MRFSELLEGKLVTIIVNDKRPYLIIEEGGKDETWEIPNSVALLINSLVKNGISIEHVDVNESSITWKCLDSPSRYIFYPAIAADQQEYENTKRLQKLMSTFDPKLLIASVDESGFKFKPPSVPSSHMYTGELQKKDTIQITIRITKMGQPPRKVAFDKEFINQKIKSKKMKV